MVVQLLLNESLALLLVRVKQGDVSSEHSQLNERPIFVRVYELALVSHFLLPLPDHLHLLLLVTFWHAHEAAHEL